MAGVGQKIRPATGRAAEKAASESAPGDDKSDPELNCCASGAFWPAAVCQVLIQLVAAGAFGFGADVCGAIGIASRSRATWCDMSQPLMIARSMTNCTRRQSLPVLTITKR